MVLCPSENSCWSFPNVIIRLGGMPQNTGCTQSNYMGQECPKSNFPCVNWGEVLSELGCRKKPTWAKGHEAHAKNAWEGDALRSKHTTRSDELHLLSPWPKNIISATPEIASGGGGSNPSNLIPTSSSHHPLP